MPRKRRERWDLALLKAQDLNVVTQFQLPNQIRFSWCKSSGVLACQRLQISILVNKRKAHE
jgi:hypothetical protein